MTTIEQELGSVFRRHAYTWLADGEQYAPSLKDIRGVIEKAKELLLKENDEQSTPQLEIGRLIIQKNDEYFDIYVLIGSEPVSTDEEVEK